MLYICTINQNVLQLDKRTVDVMTGVTTGDLKTFQLKQKLSLNANVILDLVQVVSVAQTGCHVSLLIVLQYNSTKLYSITKFITFIKYQIFTNFNFFFISDHY